MTNFAKPFDVELSIVFNSVLYLIRASKQMSFVTVYYITVDTFQWDCVVINDEIAYVYIGRETGS